MQIAKRLNSGEIILLRTVYEIYQNKQFELNSNLSAEEWLREISKKLNLPKEIIELYEEKLINLKLITKRKHQDMSGIQITNTYRLTDLGKVFCEYIDNFK